MITLLHMIYATSKLAVAAMHFFFLKKLATFFLVCCPQNIKAINAAEIVSLSK